MLKIDEQRVRVWMATRNVRTIEELAQRAGVSSFTIRRLFAGEEFRSSTLSRLANVLEVNPLDLIYVSACPDPHVVAPALAAA